MPLSLLIVACENSQPYKVKHYGALRTIMHDGDLSAKIRLDTIEDRTHLYALGAVKNLKGEIIILDGKTYISAVIADSVHLSSNATTGAALLVSTKVRHWRELEIPDDIKVAHDFEEYLREVAQSNGIDIDNVIPFRITGTLKYGEWHVIDWPEGDTEHTQNKHKNSGLRGNIEDRSVEILGFYSTEHHGIFTHMSNNMHLHFVSQDRQIAAHLDNFTLGKTNLLIPNWYLP
jgi:acetolactate decarboxylase